jgi:hypothetical protein
MTNVITSGLAMFGIGRLIEIEKLKPMDNYDGGVKDGRRTELDDIMSSLVGVDNWQTAKDNYYEAQSATQRGVRCNCGHSACPNP